MAQLLVSELVDYCLEDINKCIKCTPRMKVGDQYYILCSYHEGWIDGIDTKFAQMAKIMDKELGRTNVNWI